MVHELCVGASNSPKPHGAALRRLEDNMKDRRDQIVEYERAYINRGYISISSPTHTSLGSSAMPWTSWTIRPSLLPRG